MKHFSIVQEDATADGELLQLRAFSLQLPRKLFANGKTVFGKMNSRGQHFGELQLVVGLKRAFNGSDRARHRERFVADDGKFFVERAIRFDVHVSGGFGGSNLAVVEECRASICETDKQEATAADVSCRRLD